MISVVINEKKHSMDKETKLFLRKLDKLDNILNTLDSGEDIKTKQMIKDIQNKCQKTRNNVTKENTLNAGGKFEWVDSRLIKVLLEILNMYLLF